MKKISILFLSAITLGIVTTSCTGEDNTVDTVLGDVTNGAVLRTISIISNEIPIGDDTALFSIEIEEQDNQEGALLESVDVYTTFADGSPDDGDSTGATTTEVFLFNIPASEFTPGPFGLPRTTITIPATTLIAAVGLTNDGLFGGDTFTTRLSLNLTDGRIFSVNNAGGIITGGFFNSPFQYVTPVVCPVEAGSFTGDYNVTQISPSIFGYDTFDPDGGGVVLTLEDADGAGNLLASPELASTQRGFDADYIAALGFGNTRTYILDFICGVVVVATGQPTGLQCAGGGITLGPPSGAPGTYDFADDSTFNMVFTDDEIDDCGQGSPDVELRWDKQ